MSLSPPSPATPVGAAESVAPTGSPVRFELDPGAFVEATATITVTNADPSGEISLAIEAPPEHWASFRTPVDVDDLIAGDAPELVAIDAFSAWIKIGADARRDRYGPSFDFVLRLPVSLSAEVGSLHLSAHAAPGTEIVASLAGPAEGRVAGGETVLSRRR